LVRRFIFDNILRVLRNYPMPSIGQMINIWLYSSSLEQLPDAMSWSDES